MLICYLFQKKANLGILEHLPQILSITKSNLCLLQCQGTIVSLLASLVGVFTMIKENDKVDINHILLLVTSNVITANIACTLLSALMIGIILFCKHKSINPDNVATPIASSLGDVSTVFLLGFISSHLYECIELKNYWLSPFILLVILLITPFSTYVAFKNKHTKKILKFGWAPIIISMVISSFAGVILDKVVKMFNEFALFQPIINGVGGNLAAIQASRISTYLYKTTRFGELPKKELSTIDSKIMETCGTLEECQNNSEANFFSDSSYIQLDERVTNEDFKEIDLNDDDKGNQQTSVVGNKQQAECFNRASYKTRKLLRIRRKKIRNYLKVIFSSGSIHKKCARLLILITLPMHVLYFYLIQLIAVDSQGNSPFFIIFYLMVALSQVRFSFFLSLTNVTNNLIIFSFYL